MVAKPRILLVDDDPAMLEILARWLEKAEYSVRRVGDGGQAMAEIESDCPNIVVTDWIMPVCDGLELCRWIRRQQHPHYIYTIMLTACAGPDELVQGLDAGADDFLPKPVKQAELLARVRSGSRVLELESRLSELAKADPLTGLANQRTFYEDMGREWSRSKRYHLPVSCVMLDIDFFKRINDTHGHPVGDEVIRRVGQILVANCRGTDVVSRYGGEEFCVLLPETDEPGAMLWAERVRKAISDVAISADNSELQITSSFGVAQRMADTSSPEALVDLADQSLLVAKQSGRDRVVGYQSLAHSTARKLDESERDEQFAEAVARDAMTVIVAALDETKLVGDAVRYFLAFRITSAPVVDHEGAIVGILSERDVMNIMLWPEWWKMRIGDVMKRNVVRYEEQTPVREIFEFLCRVAIRSVVIVKDERPTGLISRSSLLRWFTNSKMLRSEGSTRATTNLLNDPSAVHVQPEHVLLTAGALAAEATYLDEQLRRPETDAVPVIVGGATHIQELVNDLLACSRYLDLSPEAWDGSLGEASVSGGVAPSPHETDSATQGGASVRPNANLQITENESQTSFNCQVANDWQ